MAQHQENAVNGVANGSTHLLAPEQTNGATKGLTGAQSNGHGPSGRQFISLPQFRWTDAGVVEGPPSHLERTSSSYDPAVWVGAPMLTGVTRFEPLSDVKRIMITGGAGFM